ncbi:hypothetical protein DRE_07500 [Drechslerella stenobrocha 248]|uniref:Metallo-dependent hydrolase n=1 Tax=Drechslerella stenobrocha 248 TaxID=1043628 RepID=W7I457_9PEZI|nr:hypothetical protein DRE_07500 [Drechslerella stenobrocha 248]
MADPAPSTLDDDLWALGVHDAHCHPTDTMSLVSAIPDRRTRTLTIMATREHDQDLVAQVARTHGVDLPPPSSSSSVSTSTCRVVPCFGWHPWYSHLLLDDTDATPPPSKAEHYASVLLGDPSAEFIAALPDPLPLSVFLSQTRQRLVEFPSALIGEVGIDRTFRIPYPEALGGASTSTGGPAGGHSRLSPHRVAMDHQRRVLVAQLRLAGEMQRAVSVHGVGAHGVLYDVFKGLFAGYEKKVRSRQTQKRGPYDFAGDESSSEDEGEGDGGGEKVRPFPPRVCLHSFSAPVEVLGTWLAGTVPADVYFSFSRAVNLEDGAGKFAGVVKVVPAERVLVESDLDNASEQVELDLAAVVRRVAEERGWELERTVRQLGENWQRFVYGGGGDGGEK